MNEEQVQSVIKKFEAGVAEAELAKHDEVEARRAKVRQEREQAERQAAQVHRKRPPSGGRTKVRIACPFSRRQPNAQPQRPKQARPADRRRGHHERTACRR
jgi:hypothetical protein